jgi:hypothetical protein
VLKRTSWTFGPIPRGYRSADASQRAPIQLHEQEEAEGRDRCPVEVFPERGRFSVTAELGDRFGHTIHGTPGHELPR